MSNIRKRVSDEQKRSPNNISSSNHYKESRQTDKGDSMKRRFFTLICLTLLFILIGSYFQALPWNIYHHGTTVLDNLSLKFGFQKHEYAVVIDAGSTGTRVLAFTFHKSLIDGTLKLDDELFRQMTPGLSSFVDDPKEGGKQMISLLESAKSVVPVSERGVTPLVMKATAGLRLLPREKADLLLEEVREVFRESPFHTSEHSVSIMDGTDEGLFSWFTVNFLLDKFGDGPEETVAALDLGGGSTQITFALADTSEAEVRGHDPEAVHEIHVFHHKLEVYTESYLGLGLMAARQGIMTAGQSLTDPDINSPCINPIINNTWDYNGIKYSVKGSKNPSYLHIKEKKGVVEENRPIVNSTECLKIVKSYVAHKVYKPKDLVHREISAFSYYYDRATEVGLIDEEIGGVVTVKQFFEAAESVCGFPNVDQPFMCLDLSFISVLLRDGFGLPVETKINLFKKIDNHEISWALGAAFHVLENGV